MNPHPSPSAPDRPAASLAGWRALVLAVVGACSSASALAAPASPDPSPSTGEASQLPANLTQDIQALVGPVLTPATGAGTPRVEVEVGRLDPRLKLAPCRKIQPHLPPGTRLWGRSRIGLRCVEGAVAWNVYVPITVKVWGQAMVAQRALPAQTVLSPTDVALAEVDLAAAATPALTTVEQLEGRTTAVLLQAGETVRQGHLKLRQWFKAGETVRIHYQGEGFTVTQEGIAITPGIEGQVARVRTENGKVITAMPTAERTVRLTP